MRFHELGIVCQGFLQAGYALILAACSQVKLPKKQMERRIFRGETNGFLRIGLGRLGVAGHRA